jgi:hypothetical protein
MRVTYSQLLAAADNMVAGVEVWVQAQSKLGIVSDIPPAAVSICYGFHEVSDAMAPCPIPHVGTCVTRRICYSSMQRMCDQAHLLQ